MKRVFSKLWGAIKPTSTVRVINSGIFPTKSLNYMTRTKNIGIVSKATLLDLLKKPNFTLIDVRNSNEVEWGMIPTAFNIPLGQLHGALQLSDEKFKMQYGFSKPSKDQKLIFYCHSGVRSQSACELASAMGFMDVSNYKGSWIDWTS